MRSNDVNSTFPALVVCKVVILIMAYLPGLEFSLFPLGAGFIPARFQIGKNGLNAWKP